jgi:hypothetical protein
MELNKNQILKIFSRNFNSETVSTPIGNGFKMNAYEAFIFCSVTGSGYLDNPIMPFTPKGLLKVFYNAMHYNFVTGLFDNTNLKYTPYNLNQLFPFLFEDDYKIIVPIEFKSDIELQDFLFEKIATIDNPTQLIIMRVETSKKGNGLEPLMEYIANRYFVNKGFICENQIPLSHSLGSPDFGGYGIPEILEVLSKYNLNFRGLNMIEFAMLRFKNTSIQKSKVYTEELIVGEAKTSTTIMEKQLEKYLSSELFSYGIEIHPNKQIQSKTSFGLLNFNNQFIIKYIPPTNPQHIIEIDYQNKYKIWLKNYVILYLIANLSNNEFQEFHKKIVGRAISTNEDITSFVEDLKFETILDNLQELNII